MGGLQWVLQRPNLRYREASSTSQIWVLLVVAAASLGRETVCHRRLWLQETSFHCRQLTKNESEAAWPPAELRLELPAVQKVRGVR
jgi:hypothetical protein